jgi:hypothetical protein
MRTKHKGRAYDGPFEGLEFELNNDRFTALIDLPNDRRGEAYYRWSDVICAWVFEWDKFRKHGIKARG